MRLKVIFLAGLVTLTVTSAAEVERVPCARSTSHLCGRENFCIHEKHVCDGEEDCRDGSDERECPFKCDGEQFKCKGSYLFVQQLLYYLFHSVL